jgi:hypothetical protein
VKNFMQQSSLLAGIYSLTMPPFMWRTLGSKALC